MDEGTLNKKREKAVQAKSLLENEMLREAFEIQINDIVKLWKSSESQGADFRERLFYMYQGVEGAREHLQRVLGDGKNAEKELLKIVKEPSKLQRFFS